MITKKTGFEGLVEMLPEIFEDNRGYFLEAFNEQAFRTNNLDYNFVQDNQSFSKKGVIRGLHLQLDPHAQAKYVRVLSGKVKDVAVDLRPGSKTFGQVFSCILDSKINNSLLIPEGFAHGFSALEDSIFYYKCSSLFNKPSDAGIAWDDKTLNIDWEVENPIVSEKDMLLPSFQEFLDKYEIVH